jgi:Mrp family chromosome partitioning ATPase
MAHRLLVTNTGELPVVAQDRRARMAGGGAIAGACFPIAMILMLGWCDRRYRRCKELAEDLGEQTPFVAVLPEVEGEPARASDAVRAVHQLRVLLESGSGVFLVSGGEGGEGKSSVALALGLSYAAAGLRTLIVDADFTSRTLTRNLKLDGAPVDWSRMLEGGAVANQARRVWSRLFLLPAGERARGDLSAVSSAGLDGLVDEMRRIADVVLIDTGAGATESALARRADGVLLVVGRGQKHERLRDAMRRYDLLGVPLAGVVFNRAEQSDFYATSGVKREAPMELFLQPAPAGLEGFGPLAGAVATSLKLKIAKGAAVRPVAPEEAPRSEAA